MRGRLLDAVYHDEAPNRFISNSACDKLYKKDTIGQTEFINGILMEDLPFNTEIFAKGVKMVLSAERYYVYRINPNSITHLLDLDKMQIRARDSEIIHRATLRIVPKFKRYLVIAYVIENAKTLYKTVSYCRVGNEPAKQLIATLRDRLKAAKTNGVLNKLNLPLRILIWCELALPLPILTAAIRCTKPAVRFADRYIRKIE
jgi:hypothetical protein